MKIGGLKILFVSTIFSLASFAQSARPVPSPTPTPEGSTTEVITTTPPACNNKLDRTIYLSPRKADVFVDELNRLGSCGYRLLAVDMCGRKHLFGVVEHDPGNKYEYRLFAAGSGGRAVTLANKIGEEGFYFRKYMMYLSDPGSEPEETRNTAGIWFDFPQSGSLYVFERKNNVLRKREYRMLDGADKRGEKALALNQKILDEKVAAGFRPVGIYYTGMFDVHQILVEKDDEIKPQGDYLILRYSYNVTKIFTRLAQQGYEPMAVGYYFAVLHRTNREPIPLRYESFDNFNKPPTVVGSRYAIKGIDPYAREYDEMIENKLFYSSSLDNNPKKYEQKILTMSDFWERRFKKKDKTASLTDPPTPEMLAELQKLLSEGYVVRDVCLGPVIILEREVNSTQKNL